VNLYVSILLSRQLSFFTIKILSKAKRNHTRQVLGHS